MRQPPRRAIRYGGVIAGVVFGLDFIATVLPTIMLTADRFGRRFVPTLSGWMTWSHIVSGAVPAAFAGQIHDVAGDHAIPIYISGLVALLAAGIAYNINARCREPGAMPVAA